MTSSKKVPKEYQEKIIDFWKDAHVKDIMKRSNEFLIQDTADEYLLFFKTIQIIR